MGKDTGTLQLSKEHEIKFWRLNLVDAFKEESYGYNSEMKLLKL